MVPVDDLGNNIMPSPRMWHIQPKWLHGKNNKMHLNTCEVLCHICYVLIHPRASLFDDRIKLSTYPWDIPIVVLSAVVSLYFRSSYRWPVARIHFS